MHGHMSRCTVTCHDARSHERKIVHLLVTVQNNKRCTVPVFNYVLTLEDPIVAFGWRGSGEPAKCSHWTGYSEVVLRNGEVVAYFNAFLPALRNVTINCLPTETWTLDRVKQYCQSPDRDGEHVSGFFIAWALVWVPTSFSAHLQTSLKDLSIASHPGGWLRTTIGGGQSGVRIEVLPSPSEALLFSETSGNANPASSSHILGDLDPLVDDLVVKITMWLIKTVGLPQRCVNCIG